MTAGNSSFLTTWFCCLYVHGLSVVNPVILASQKENSRGSANRPLSLPVSSKFIQPLFKDSVSACMCGMACGCQ